MYFEKPKMYAPNQTFCTGRKLNKKEVIEKRNICLCIITPNFV